MTNKKDIDSGFRVNRILLLESNFSRIANVTFNDPLVTSDVNIDVASEVHGDKIFVTLSLNYNQSKSQIQEVSCVIKMLGEFEKIGDNILNLDKFGQVNGAAILYPYIREQLSNLSLKAGLGNIILPPANFVKLNS
jgi:preprotein translocase subunit SecB